MSKDKSSAYKHATFFCFAAGVLSIMAFMKLSSFSWNSALFSRLALEFSK